MIASRRLRGLLWVVVVIGIGLFNGCGGDDDDDDDVPNECVSACNTGCTRAASCQFISGSDINACSNSCVDTIEREGRATAQSCQETAVTIAGASCNQLADLLGLRGVESTPRAEGQGGEETSSLAAVLQGIIKAITEGN